MRLRFRHIGVLVLAALLAAACIKYDMSYPRILAEFTEFKVEGAESVNIDRESMTVTVTLDEAEDISAVRVTSVALNDKAFFKDGEFPEVLDLREPYKVLLSMYQDYRWTVRAVQPVDRYVICDNQVGTAYFDESSREVFVRVSNSQRLRYLKISDMKLELEGSSVLSTTGLVIEGDEVVQKTEDCSFPMVLDCTNKRTFEVESRGQRTQWSLTVIPVKIDAMIKTVAPWCWSADIEAVFDGTSTPPVIQYRKSSEPEWITVVSDDVTVDGINVRTRLTGLSQQTEYQVRLIFNDEELPVETFVTDAPVQLPNMNFDLWWLSGDVWYPYAEDSPSSEQIWDSANAGAAQYIGSSTVPEDTDVIKGRAARLTSKWAAIKFAAGNIYTGKFKGLVGISGADLDWGIPFTSKPKALKGWYKYDAKPITRRNNKEVNGDEMDKCQLQVLLIDSEKPYRVLPVGNLNGPTYDGKLLDLETEPTVIARLFLNLDGTDTDGDGSADWVQFEFPLEYRSYRTPKYVIVTAASSYLGDYFTGGEGSTMLIDEFEFVYE